MAKQKIIAIWIPEICQKGGIQTFSKFLIEAARSHLEGKIAIFSKCDLRGDLTKIFPDQYICAFGFLPGIFRTLFWIWKLFFWSLMHRPQLIYITHVHFAPVAMVLKKIIKQKYVVVVHGAEVWNFNKLWIKESLQDADLVLSVSEFTRSKIIKQGVPPEKIDIFPNTFSEKIFQMSDKNKNIFLKYGVQKNDPVLLSVCRLVSSELAKGYDLVLDALLLLQSKFPSLKYIIVGEGDDRARIERRICSLRLSGKVVLAGSVADEDLALYYQNSDVFVLPSEREGFGIVFLEAIASGLPVIAARCAGAAEALLHGELGDLITPGNAFELSEKIEHRLSSGLIAEKNKSELRFKLIETFGFKIFCRRLVNATNRVLCYE